MEALPVINITMTTKKQVPACNLTQQAIETIERMIYKSGDDIAMSVGRSFERMEERIDAMETRLYSRIADVEDKIADVRELIQESALSLEKAGTPA
jgi:phage shock protein A